MFLLFAGVVSKQGEKIYNLSIFFLFFISAFRSVELGGTDVYIYQAFYEEVPDILHLNGFISRYGFEVGFTVLCSVLKTFSGNYLVFQFVYAAISMYLLNKVVRVLELNGAQGCLFLFGYFCLRFIYNSWVANRQNIANLLFWLFLAVFYKEIIINRNRGIILKRKTIFVLLFLFFLAPLFHASAWANLVLVPLMLCMNRLGYNFQKIFVPVLSVILWCTGTFFCASLVYLMASIDKKYLLYINTIERNGNFIYFILRMTFLFLFLFHFSMEKNELKVMFLDSLCMMVLLGSINVEIASRFFEYYGVGLYGGAMALCLNCFDNKSRMRAAVIYFSGFFVILVRFLLITDSGLYSNYTFWFQN